MSNALGLFQQFQDGFRRSRHLCNGTKASADILQAGTYKIYLVIDDQESVMVPMGELDEFDLWVLGVVFLQVDEELFVVASMDGGCDAIGSFGEHREHSVINKVVNQNDSLFGVPNEVGDESPCVPDTASWEDLLRERFGRNILDFIKNHFDGFVGFLLMLLNVEDPLYNLSVVIDELWYHRESPHDTDVDTDSDFGF